MTEILYMEYQRQIYYIIKNCVCLIINELHYYYKYYYFTIIFKNVCRILCQTNIILYKSVSNRYKVQNMLISF